MDFENFLKGKLTYIAGAATIILGIVQMIQGQTDEGIKTIILGIGIIGGRRAIGEVATNQGNTEAAIKGVGRKVDTAIALERSEGQCP